MTTDDIRKLGEAARQIAEILKKHRADGEAIRKALEPIAGIVDVDEPQRRKPVRHPTFHEMWWDAVRRTKAKETEPSDEPPKPYGMPPRCGQPLTPRAD